MTLRNGDLYFSSDICQAIFPAFSDMEFSVLQGLGWGVEI